MPDIDGFMLVEQINRLKESNQIFKPKIIAFSAHECTDMIQKCLKGGFDSYMTKPLEREKLIKVIQNL